MKRKNLLLIVTLLLAMVLLPNVVNAAASASNWMLYCGDNNTTVSKEEPVYCYLIAQIENEGNTGIHGVYTGIEVDKLELIGAGSIDPNLIKMDQYNYQQARSTIPQENIALATCNQKSGCYDFFSVVPNAITNKGGQNVGNEAGISDINSDYSGYTIIGWYQVKLTDDADADNCGEICVYLNPVLSDTSLTTPSDIGAPSLDNGQCVEIKPKVIIEPEKPKTCVTEGEGDNIKYIGKNGNEVTKEVYEKECGNPGTGGWASYAVLAAGAFIALSAITIAKKHNKFYQV